MALNHFCMEPEEYVATRVDNYNLLKLTADQYSWFLNRRTGKPLAKCKEFVDSVIKGNEGFLLEDPKAVITTKDKNNDRVLTQVPYSRILTKLGEANWMVSPSMMAYDRPEVKRSITGEASKNNKVERYRLKKEMYEAYQAKDVVLGEIKNLLQNNRKTLNNSMSGAHSSAFNIMWFPSAHTSLTSICRTATSYANGHNEKFIRGNRHYYSYDVAHNNIVSICSSLRTKGTYDFVAATIAKFNLYIPTAKQISGIIEQSSRYYWHNSEEMDLIRNTVNSLDDVERCAFAYIGDFYHLRRWNDAFVREFMTRMAYRAETITVNLEEADELFSTLRGDLDTHLSTLHAKDKGQLKWKELRNGVPAKDDAPAKEPKLDAYLLAASTIQKFNHHLDDNQDLIDAFWKTDNMPQSIHEFPSSLRKTVIGSDTDSTMFTVHNWVQWYQHSDAFNETSIGIGGAITYISSQVNVHLLAIMSGQQGVCAERIHDYTMKSEYYFPVMMTSSIPKHYITLIAAQEGLVYDDPKLDKKGVGLIKSKVVQDINKSFENLVSIIIKNIMEGNEMTMQDVVGYVADLESTIRQQLLNKNSSYLEYSRINTKEHSLSGGRPIESTKYFYHMLWNAVFAPKYGYAEEPTYDVYKVNILGGSKSALKEIINGIEDKALAFRFTEFLTKYKKEKLEVLYLPADIVKNTGIPDELLAGGNLNKVVSGVISHFYLILESFGIYINDKKSIRSFDERYSNLLGTSTFKKAA